MRKKQDSSCVVLINNNNKMSSSLLPDNISSLLDCNEIIPRLFLGSEDAAYADINLLKGEPYGFTHICVCGFGLTRKYENDQTHPIQYYQIKAVDLPIYDITKDAISCAEFIEKALADDENNRVLVHVCSLFHLIIST